MDGALTGKSSFSHEELIECGHGRLFGPGNAQLPLPPMLMVDRITSIANTGGAYGKGALIAEYDIRPDLWFFECHFEGDPVMPGCLGLDAMWQLLGFHIGWLGGQGRGRALGVGEVKLTSQVLQTNKLITYQLDIRRVIMRKLVMGIADGTMQIDGVPAYQAKNMRVGLLTNADSIGGGDE